MSTPRLEELRRAIEDARRGDGDPIGAIIAHRWPALLARVRWMMGPEARRKAETADFLQEAIVCVLRGLPHFELRDEAGFWSWILAIAHRRIGDAVRIRRMDRFHDLSTTLTDGGDGHGAVERALREEELQRMAEALEAMSEDRRTVIELRDLEELSFRDIALRMGRSENAVQVLHARSLAELARRLGT